MPSYIGATWITARRGAEFVKEPYENDPTSASVVKAKRYAASTLYTEFHPKWEGKYRHIRASFAAWGGRPEDRYDRG